MIKEFIYPSSFDLESGQKLEQLKITYSEFGCVEAEKIIWVCHALSGNSIVTDWWGRLFGEAALFNFKEYRIICANVVGSCYGSTGPDELENVFDFPLITIRDMVNAHILLRKQLKIDEIDILIGASLGGQQAVEWAITEPRVVRELILIATNAVHSPFSRAFNEAQRLALTTDPTFGKKYGGFEGLKAARAIAMLSYRSYADFQLKQQDDPQQMQDFKAPSYVRYQGLKFINRFKPGAYYTLSKAMDSHDVGRGRQSRMDALLQITARTLVVGIDSDTLFPLQEQQYLADFIPDAELAVIHSPHGHDAFLINYAELEEIILEFLKTGNGNNQSGNPQQIEDQIKKYIKYPTQLKTQTVNNEK